MASAPERTNKKRKIHEVSNDKRMPDISFAKSASRGKSVGRLEEPQILEAGDGKENLSA